MRTLAMAMCFAGAVVLGVVGCSRDRSAEHEEGHHDDHATEIARGPHGGRLFTQGTMQLELRIAEDDGPPQFLAYLYDDAGVARSPVGATLALTLDRFAHRRQTIEFAPVGTYLRGDAVVYEPHSFHVTIDLAYAGEVFQWQFEQIEFRVELSPEAVTRGGIEVAPAGPAEIEVQVSAPGEVLLNGERMLIVRPRFAGIVTEMRKQLGDAVAAGETIAVIQSNESLTEYAIKAPMAGQVVARGGMVGASVDNQAILYTLADLSTVWVDFAIYPQHVGVIRRGQPVAITASTRTDLIARGTVSYVGPLLEQDTRVSHGRIVLPNPEGVWQPGLYVTIDAVVDRARVPVAVPEAAILRSKFGPSVFIADGSTFELQPITPGRTNGIVTEVASGIAAGTVVVVKNAFLLKAELGRSEATHDH